MINKEVMNKIKHIVVSRDNYKQKMVACWEQSKHIINSYITW